MTADEEKISAPRPKPKDIQTRWGGRAEMLTHGFVGVPILFLERAASLSRFRLNPAETLFVIMLMAHKWDEQAPFPGYKRLAKWMGKTESYARKLARDLEAKGYLKRIERSGYTNKFDLAALFDAIVAETDAKTKATPPKTRSGIAATSRSTTRQPKRPTSTHPSPRRAARTVAS